MTLDETFDYIFKQHKDQGGKHSTFIEWIEREPDFFQDARNTMIRQEIILEQDNTITVLNPKISACNSYKEALHKMQEKENRENQLRNITIEEKTTIVANQPKEFKWKKWGLIIAAIVMIIALLRALLNK
jgi:hypothetical protein